MLGTAVDDLTVLKPLLLPTYVALIFDNTFEKPLPLTDPEKALDLVTSMSL